MKKFIRLSIVAIMCLMLTFSAVACDDTPSVHEHEWEMTHDSNNHWYKCKSCEETKDLAEHELSTISSTEADCTTDGVTVKKCEVCGYEKEITASATGHNYVPNHDETKHWLECEKCHDKKDEENHAFDSCVRFDGVYHTKICSGCSLPYKEDGEIVKYPHNIVDGSCTECKSTEQKATEGLIFEENGEFYTLAGIESNAGASDIIVPTFYNGKIVTQIKESAFEGNSTIRSIVIPDGVTTIGKWAFWNCSSLSTITIGKGVKTFSDAVFYNTQISRVNYMGTVEDWCKIEFGNDRSHPFYSSIAGSRNIWLSDNTKLTSVTIPDDMTKINAYSFYQCESIKEITLGKSITEIGDNAFYNCTNLEYVGFAEAPLESIGVEAFYGCKLNGYIIELPQTMKTLKTGAFKMTSISSVSIPSSVKTVGQDCFLGCASLKDVEVGAGVEIIAGSAFKDCFNLSNVVLNSGLKEIWASAFDGCETLENITLPDTLESVYGNAFYSCALKSVTIPASCKSLMSGTFQACGKLTSLTIEGGSVPLTIGKNAFMSCSLLTEVSIPDRVTEIGESAFKFSGLTKITIGSGVVKLGTEAFWGCDFTEFTVSDQNTAVANISGCIVDLGTKTIITSLEGATVPDDERVTAIGNSAFKNADIQTVVIPERITSVGKEAFRGCKNLTSVTLPNSMSVIPEWIFGDCEKLTNVTLGNNVTEIGLSAFKGCTQLETLIIPESVKKIGASAFSGCTSLVTSIGDNVEYIGEYAFENCTKSFVTVDRVHYIGKWAIGFEKSIDENDQWTNLALKDDTLGIAGGAFSGATFSTVILPSTVKYVGKYAFCENDALTNVTLSSGLLEIGAHAFKDCVGITEITIPASVVEIDEYAFTGCTNLTKVTFENTEGWKRYSSATATYGYTADASNPTANATSLKGDSSGSYIWRREA